MSLLDRGQVEVTVFPEIVTSDADGNTITKASKQGFKARATLQRVGQSGTSARRAEQDNEGYQTEEMYRMRFARGSTVHELGAQSRIDWNGESWGVFGEAQRYMGSPRTAHTDYIIIRN